ncbi:MULTISPECIES: PDGLE domain-containing protein [Nocardioides]|uniref:PDGLE domain-containing protein n=1 Tax=Nocardioides vastitatis TaxID=2568655 RepID=A0ABW0ZCB1_9ACTN|nr:PDGLE domain-containing protein [Nocardioides sp.]
MTSPRISKRAFLLVGLLTALLIAGVGSYYASGHPDGLEYVAERTGFIDSAQDGAAADSPFADYGTKGVEDPRVGGGIAGVVGVLATLLLAGGLFMLLRRKPDPAALSETK